MAGGSLDVPNNAPNAALLGASKAFGKPTPKPKPKPHNVAAAIAKNDDTRTNGALSAATAAGLRSRTNSPEHLSPNQRSTTPYSISPGSARSNGGISNRNSLEVGGTTGWSSRYQSRSPVPAKSTAVLAASRVSPSPSPAPAPLSRSTTGGDGAFKNKPRPAAPPKPRRLSLHRRTSSHESIHNPTDDAPIPPTTSLVDLFERKSNDKAPRKKQVGPIIIKPHSDLAIRSPQPIRVSDGLDRALQAGMDVGAETQAAQREGGRQEAFPSQPAQEAQGGRGKAGGGGSSKARRRSTSARRSISHVDDADLSPPGELYFSASEDTAPSPSPPVTLRRDSAVRTNLLQPTPPAFPRARPSPSPLRNSHNSKPPASAPIDIKPPLSRGSISSTLDPSPSTKSIAATYHTLYPRRTTPLTSSPDLATAMVASNLASHRFPFPTETKPPPSPPPRRHHHIPFTRTPSPSKKPNAMRQTLRSSSPSASDSDEDTNLHPYGKHKKKRHLRPKAPNKHHEGTRKRWREAVTERERKRYEGLWAANRGCLLQPTSSSSDLVSNIIVRDLWSRSRLPDQELELIWDLVDGGGRGALGKEEFVVGLWLVDQRLKGRKVPVNVGDTVWASVRGIQGIKVKKFVGR